MFARSETESGKENATQELVNSVSRISRIRVKTLRMSHLRVRVKRG